MGIRDTLRTLRHNAGEAFLQALDDIRQKVVEEGWAGATQTPARLVDHQHSDPMPALYGAAAATAGAAASTLNASWLHPSEKPDPTLAWIRGEGIHTPPKGVGLDEPGKSLGEDQGLEL